MGFIRGPSRRPGVQEVPPDALVLRPMTTDDVEPVGAIAQSLGRNVGASDYARFLALEGAHGYVLTREAVILGAATVLRYFEHAFLGPVLLRTDADGLAIALLAQLVEMMQRDGVRVIEAEAAAAEEAILARMGFATLRRTIVLERAAGGRSEPAGSVPMEHQHLLDVGALDAAAVGYGRKEYLLALMRELPAGARVVQREGDVVGYALMRRAPLGYALGPLVTREGDAETATALLRDTLTVAAGSTVVALVPEGSALLAPIEREGFRPVGDLARMRAGERDASAGAVTEWAVGSRLTG